MAVSGFQDFWVAGARVYFQRLASGSTNYPVIDLGVCQSASPTIEPNKIELKDPDGGIRRTVATAVIEINETYDIELNNFNPDNLALMFSSTPPETYTQSATPVTNVNHDCPETGRLVKIRDANGDPVYNIASIQAVTNVGGTETYVLDTHYEVVSLARGIIRIILRPGAEAADADIEIDYTKTAISTKRLIKPQTAGAAVNGEMWIFYGRGNNAQQTVRYAPSVDITPAGINLQSEDFSSFTLQATVLSDVTEAIPAGDLRYFIGDLPDLS